MSIYRCFLLATLVVLMASCGGEKGSFYYLTDRDSTGRDTLTAKLINPVIQKNDLIGVYVYSASTLTEVNIDALYNLPEKGGEGYLVDPNGNISIPRIGSIKAEGLTKNELAELVKQKVTATGELADPNVIVRFLNYRITVLGEVSRPGTYPIPAERVTILEALGLAGDVTVYGKKNDVMVLREKDGVIEYGKVDLSTKEVFSSPYFLLAQNDVVIVNAVKNKNRVDEQVTMQRVSLGLSVVTSLLLIYNIFK